MKRGNKTPQTANLNEPIDFRKINGCFVVNDTTYWFDISWDDAWQILRKENDADDNELKMKFNRHKKLAERSQRIINQNYNLISSNWIQNCEENDIPIVKVTEVDEAEFLHGNLRELYYSQKYKVEIDGKEFTDVLKYKEYECYNRYLISYNV